MLISAKREGILEVMQKAFTYKVFKFKFISILCVKLSMKDLEHINKSF